MNEIAQPVNAFANLYVQYGFAGLAAVMTLALVGMVYWVLMHLIPGMKKDRESDVARLDLLLNQRQEQFNQRQDQYLADLKEQRGEFLSGIHKQQEAYIQSLTRQEARADKAERRAEKMEERNVVAMNAICERLGRIEAVLVPRSRNEEQRT